MPKIIPVAVFDCVVFGATGDLTLRKLLPALYYRFRDGQMPAESRVIGAARSHLSDDDFRSRAAAALEKHVAPGDQEPDLVKRFLAQLHYVSIDATSPDANWGPFRDILDDNRIRVFYLATSPDLYGPVCEALAVNGLVTVNSRVVLEKPIGHDLESARAIISGVGKVFSEAQTFRIDHYLGKETVQNLLALRFANTIFERVWSSRCHRPRADHGGRRRWGWKGAAIIMIKSGALRDMLQNHLLQLLCMVAMEPPVILAKPMRVRDEKLKVLRALKPIEPHEIAACSRCAANIPGGAVERTRPCPAIWMISVPEHHHTSRTETFVALKAEMRNPGAGAGVPFYLRTGKRLPSKVSEIVIQFRATPFSLFPPEAAEWRPNTLIIRLQPEEGMRLEMMTKDPGPGGLRLSPTGLDIRFEKTFGVRFPDAYERLLMDTVRGNPTLFMRHDEVEAAWIWVEPILQAWAARPDLPRPYPAGSWGPTAAIALIERDGRTWHEEVE